ncbi:hypothetical protein M6B38_185325 [Iris pallida]|uniref:Uncharacterized protein n=1 Tax=Iris pallida TaxID=29817 RepID=A0AAX6ELG3_IRIPA|nr:hypothetical protein M6B38_185325 [Iris pallida]
MMGINVEICEGKPRFSHNPRQVLFSSFFSKFSYYPMLILNELGIHF